MRETSDPQDVDLQISKNYFSFHAVLYPSVLISAHIGPTLLCHRHVHNLDDNLENLFTRIT